jgi:hypothetical protein
MHILQKAISFLKDKTQILSVKPTVSQVITYFLVNKN